MSTIRRLVLNIIKPRDAALLGLADKLGDLDGVRGVAVTLVEAYGGTETVKVIVEGDDIYFPAVAEVLQAANAAIQTVDKVSAGRELIEDDDTDLGGRWRR